jgi:hypothetical protein
MPEEKVAEGPKGQIVFWAETKSKLKRMVREATAMAEKSVQKIFGSIHGFTETGKYPVSPERFKPYTAVPGVFVFKHFQVRWYGVKDGTKFAVLHVCLKKTQKVPKDVKKTIKNKKRRYYETKDLSN